MQVRNFKGVNEFNKYNEYVKDKKYDEVLKKDSDDKNKLFSAYKELEKYKLLESTRGNVIQECYAYMSMPKGRDRNEDVFQNWRIVTGARLYRNKDDTTPWELDE